ncbi:glycosyltransferase family 4 protein [Caminibacter pacificus]|uniref:Glycosyltransferase n=1 Tax=Caminibacter pacificus TaxID=1424653 RepID=A0AAJ4RC05_9BACT|nr:glycosyltransferase [Caminibacter pacificus]QDD68115.1 glycosyltransferase [Caminibacter pacificus]ROR39151.1 glycosyltransferase involved in cell wall biosynthesis [Caminibacter pacificus]
MENKNILLIAYACEPDNGSEPEVGWQVVNHIAKQLPKSNIYVITKANNKEKIEQKPYPKNITFLYYELPKWASFWKKKQRGIRTYYYLWMIGAVKFLKGKNIRFDLIHHVTFVNDWLPSIFILLKNQRNKFIWGPIGSHDFIDFRFLKTKKQKIVEFIRRSLQLFFRNFDPFFYMCKKKSDCVIGINQNVKEKIGLKNKCFIAEPAIGVERELVESIKCKEKDEFNIISVGRLIYIKNFEMSIRAFSEFIKRNKLSDIKLNIIGDGSDRKYLENLAKELNIEKQVVFKGKIPLKKVYEEFSKSSVFIFPTFENAGFVFLEAMMNCLPVVGLDYGGASQFVISKKEKQLVDINQPYEKIVKDLSLRLEDFYKNENLRKKVGQKNREDVLNNFTWDKKAQKFIEIYKKVLNEK